jgi:hypothetical protein
MRVGVIGGQPLGRRGGKKVLVGGKERPSGKSLAKRRPSPLSGIAKSSRKSNL